MPSTAPHRLLIVGVPDREHVGRHFADAAAELGVECRILDARDAYSRSRVVTKLWRVLGRKYPPRRAAFARGLGELARAFRPTACLVTGTSHVEARDLTALAALGIRTLHYSTDDPWNPNFRAPWLFEALARYDTVFTTRRANLAELRELGVSDVRWLPFAYSSGVHRPATEVERARSSFDAEVVFIGGADADRVPYILALARAGLRVAVFGGYWRRFDVGDARVGGIIELDEVRAVLARSKMSVCLVRRKNRDGHVMRTYEEPAMGSCMLFERTAEHADLFGASLTERAAFETPEELVSLARRLRDDAPERERIRDELHARVALGANTYADRLRDMLSLS